MTTLVRKGRPDPLGATPEGDGVNFALFSEHATAVDLCLFDDAGTETRVRLPARTRFVWHGFVPGVRPGQRYGYRVHGPYDPPRGFRFNDHKLLVDPYARAFAGKTDYAAPIYGHVGHVGRAGADPEAHEPDLRDDAAGVPKSVVVDAAFDWQGDARPRIPWKDTVVYEAHVKGFTKRLEAVPEADRGTYLGFASDAAITHLQELGVTAVELLPVHEAMDEPFLPRRGLTNYWGYSTLGFFAPDQRWARTPGAQVVEFKTMVRALHRAGIEVWLDVVYNHTCEGGAAGPTVSFRGIDNLAYYHLKPDAAYADYTGCGNSLNVAHPQTLKLVLDSLRYWVEEMHVDGFRFDLASTLGRARGGAVDLNGPFFAAVHQDPVLSRVKLVAEPWDTGDGGYLVGRFPVAWSEWNGPFRDVVRRFWTGNAKVVGELGYRLTGSSDLYQDDGRDVHAGINFVTAHDGFTLRDLVSYARKHNLGNGEGNRDGWDDNASDNGGVEGETTDPAIRALRDRQRRNIMATLLLSQGIPMITAGDEMGKTQRGNNNAYCLDDETSWLDWDNLDGEFFAFTKELLRLRKRHPVFRRTDFFSGNEAHGSRLKDIVWFRPDGKEMEGPDWSPTRPFLGMLLSGDALPCHDGGADLDADDPDRGPCSARCDDSFLWFLSGHKGPVSVTIPSIAWGGSWRVVFDTARPGFAPGDPLLHSGDKVEMTARSTILLVRVAPVSGSWIAPKSR